MTISLRLQEAIDRAGIKSQSELARRSGVPQPTINRILHRPGRHGPSTEALRKLAAACGVSFQWLADGTGMEPATVLGQAAASAVSGPQHVSLLVGPPSGRAEQAGSAVLIPIARLPLTAAGGDAGLGIDAKGGERIYLGRGWLDSRGYDDRALVVLAMRGESMAPSLYDGDTLIVNLADKKLGDGEVFVLNYEGTVLIRRLLRDAGHWWVCSDNADQRRFQRKKYASAACEIIGRIIYRLSERI